MSDNSNNNNGERSSYVPPHLRNKGGKVGATAPPPSDNGGGVFFNRGGRGGGGGGRYDDRGGGGGGRWGGGGGGGGRYDDRGGGGGGGGRWGGGGGGGGRGFGGGGGGRYGGGGGGRYGGGGGGGGGSYGGGGRGFGGRGGRGGGRWQSGGTLPKVAYEMKRNEKEELHLFGEKKKSAGINFDKYDDIPVDCTGKGAKDPLKDFDDEIIPEVIRSNVALAGYKVPTPVQKYAIAQAVHGMDVMACAQTGSGKTAAFLLPVLCHLINNFDKLPAPTGPQNSVAPYALVVAPTRELAMQIGKEAEKFRYRTFIRPVVVYGGQPPREQLRLLRGGCHMLVATPGRLIDFLSRGNVSLCNIQFLVFDEADRMLDMGFEPQIRDIVGEFDMPRDRQTLMFSATFPNEIQELAGEFLREYIFLAVGRVGSTTESITQEVVYVNQKIFEKQAKLMELLARSTGLTLIFTETKRGADDLEASLLREGIDACSIHGDRQQHERESALRAFSSGRCPVLVATDVASRGLDIPNVTMVINFDLPNNIDDYVHRIGRTGRAGNTGTAVSMVHESNRSIIPDLYDLLVESNQEVPDWFKDLYRYIGKRGRGGGRGRFGGTDFRRNKGNRSSGGGGGGGGWGNGGGGGGWGGGGGGRGGGGGGWGNGGGGGRGGGGGGRGGGGGGGWGSGGGGGGGRGGGGGGGRRGGGGGGRGGGNDGW